MTVKAVEFERLAGHPQKPVDCRRKERSVSPECRSRMRGFG